MTSTTRILLGLAALLVVAGAASAQCPECDEDGDGNADNTYHNVNLGLVENETGTLVDTDAAHGHLSGGQGFWGWLSLCLSVLLAPIEEALGVDLGVDANAEAYVSEEGADLDATLYLGGDRWSFDESEIGDLDGQTWEVMAEANAARNEAGVGPSSYPAEIPDYEGVNVDVCVVNELHVSGC